MSNFMKIRPIEIELFHADRRTDMKKLTVAFRNFSNAPKMLQKWPPLHNQSINTLNITPKRGVNNMK
jgi:hypothetical protein